MTNSNISRDEIRSAIEDKLCASFSVTSETATDDQIFQAAAIVVRELMSRFLAVANPKKHKKEVHYLSMEFLMGRSLMKNAYNIGISEALAGALEDLGRSATDIFEAEPDAGLGNGGLGRLAACYMESMSTLGLSGTGYSICYELGIFRQKFKGGRQTEVADNWRTAMGSWLIPRYEDTVEVRLAAVWNRTGTTTATILQSTPAILPSMLFHAICSSPVTDATRSTRSAFGMLMRLILWICSCSPKESMLRVWKTAPWQK